MQAWRAPFVAGAELPLIGTTETDLRAIQRADLHHSGQRPHPRQHDRRDGGALMPDCEAHRLDFVDQDVDLVPAEEW